MMTRKSGVAKMVLTSEEIMDLQEKWQDRIYDACEEAVKEVLPSDFKHYYAFYGGWYEVDTFDSRSLGDFLDIAASDVSSGVFYEGMDVEEVDAVDFEAIKFNAQTWIDDAIECGYIKFPMDEYDLKHKLDDVLKKNPELVDYPVQVASEDYNTLFTIKSSLGWFKLMNTSQSWGIDAEYEADKAIEAMQKAVESNTNYLDNDRRKRAWNDYAVEGTLYLGWRRSLG